MANANIFSQYAQAPKSVMDYTAEFDVADARKNALQQSAMGLEQTRQTMQMSAAKNNAIREIYASVGPNADPMSLARALQRNPLTAKDGVAAEKALADTGKVLADTGESVAKGKHFEAQTAGLTQTQARERKQEAIQHIASMTDPAAAIAQINSDPNIPQQTRDTLLRSIPQNNLVAFKDWQLRTVLALATPDQQVKAMAPNVQMLTAGGSSVPVQTNTLAGPIGAMAGVAPVPITQSADNAATNATSRANNASTQAGEDRRAAAKRSSDMGIAGLANGKAPPGYVWGPPGPDGVATQIAVSGGPADAKKQGQLNADTQALTGSLSSLDRLSTAANEVLQHPGLDGIYGLRGVFYNPPGGKAADAAALLNTLKSQVGFGVLQDMRNNSKTGGALGAVSDKENAMLQANLAALEKAQSVEQARKSLAKIMEYTEQAKGRMRDAYGMKHGDRSSPAAPTPQPAADIHTQAEAILRGGK